MTTKTTLGLLARLLHRACGEVIARRLFIERGRPEAVIGLSSGLFYGTDLPSYACRVPVVENAAEDLVATMDNVP